MSLRPLSDSDLPEIMRQLSDEDTASWLAAVPIPFGPADAAALLEHGRHPGEHLRVIEADGTVAGCICLGAGLWYWLDPAAQGRGLMTSALRLALSEWFARPAPPLTATCRTDNAPSRSLLIRLGFSQSPATRRMFFQGAGRSHPCHDFLMAPEQWHLLNPPRIAIGPVTLRPARQKDASTLARTVPAPGWPTPDALPDFIEIHRFRGGASGLFVIEDTTTRAIGMALLSGAKAPALCFLSDEDALRHAETLAAALAKGLPGAGQSVHGASAAGSISNRSSARSSTSGPSAP